MSIEKRLRAVEQRINAKSGSASGAFRIVIVEGGLGEILWSYAGELKWRREPGEELDAFIERSAIAAREAGERSLVIGGLGGPEEIAEFPDFESWFAAYQPEYSDVPQVTVRG
jgi:hypothetical protein